MRPSVESGPPIPESFRTSREFSGVRWVRPVFSLTTPSRFCVSAGPRLLSSGRRRRRTRAQQKMKLYTGDCIEVIQTLDPVDSIVTDPPYGLKFMGKNWDHGVPGVAYWKECLDVLKPGGHLLAFGGTRTFHRLTCAIEDASFEIRDCIMWVYGSGFPKSLDVSKAIDKVRGETGRTLRFTRWFRSCGVLRKQATNAMIADGHISEQGTMADHFFADNEAGQPAIPTLAIWQTLRPLCIGDIPRWVDVLVKRVEEKREVLSRSKNQVGVGWTEQGLAGYKSEFNITAPATEAAKQWDGWGTALKPAWEPIIVARKPLEGTVAENVLKYGTGALNIDGCRIEIKEGDTKQATAGRRTIKWGVNEGGSSYEKGTGATYSNQGRWPANLIHDGDQLVLDLFPETKTGKTTAGTQNTTKNNYGVYSKKSLVGGGDSGSAARFFYCAKASKADRDPGNDHPTVKPTELMRYLVRLVTPPGGTVLDPFAGSGSTGKAALLEGFDFIGIDLDTKYVKIAEDRLKKLTGCRQ